MKRINMSEINMKSVIAQNELVLDNFRPPFKEGRISTSGTWDVYFHETGRRGRFQDMNFSITKKGEEKAFAGGSFAYNYSDGFVAKNSITFALSEKFVGINGMQKLAKRADAIMNAICGLVNTFGFINAVEEYNSQNAVYKTVENELEMTPVAANAKPTQANIDPTAYTPVVLNKKVYVYASEDEKEDAEGNGYDRHYVTPSWDVRGYTQTVHTKEGEKKVWVEPRTCHRSSALLKG